MPQTDGGDRWVLPREESGVYTLKWGEVNATGQHNLPHKFKDTSGCQEPGGASERRPASEHFRQWCQDGERKGVYRDVQKQRGSEGSKLNGEGYLKPNFSVSAFARWLNFTFLFRNLEGRVIPTTGGYSVHPVRWNM